MAKTSGKDAKESSSKSVGLVGRLHQFCRRVYKIVSSTLGLIVALILYSVVGAAVFHAIEGRHEAAEKHDIIAAREQLINNTWTNFSGEFDDRRQREFAAFIRRELRLYEQELHEAFLHGVNTDSEVYIWDFWSAFLFCATVYTTIGKHAIML